MSPLYQFPPTLLDNSAFDAATLHDRVVLVVNVASRCGFTPQYGGLEKLYQRYQQRGLQILAFPCTQFGGQEPGEAAEIARMAADELRRFGIEPDVALLSHSNFGSSNSASARKMRRACEILHATCPNLNVDGEVHGDAALSVEMRDKLHPDSRLKGEANLLVMPNLDAANISFNLMKMANGDGVSVGPILLGAAKPVHIVTPSATVRRLVNMTALAVVDAKETRNAGL